MIFLIHGDNPKLIKQKLDQLIDRFKTQDKKTIRIEAKKLPEFNVKQIISEKNLFGEESILVVSGCASLSPKEFKNLVAQLTTAKKEAIFWNNGEIKGKTVLSLFSPQNIFNFPAPKIIFKFLESIGQNNKKPIVLLLDETFKKEPEGLILYWLKRHFRELFLCAINSPLIDKIPGWKKKKLENQLKNLSSTKAINFYQELIEIEFRQKTGRLPEGLKTAIANSVLTL